MEVPDNVVRLVGVVVFWRVMFEGWGGTEWTFEWWGGGVREEVRRRGAETHKIE